jgi:hypothetical protein
MLQISLGILFVIKGEGELGTEPGLGDAWIAEESPVFWIPYEWKNKPNEIFMDRTVLQKVSDGWNGYGFTGGSPVAEMIPRLTRPEVIKKGEYMRDRAMQNQIKGASSIVADMMKRQLYEGAKEAVA